MCKHVHTLLSVASVKDQHIVNITSASTYWGGSQLQDCRFSLAFDWGQTAADCFGWGTLWSTVKVDRLLVAFEMGLCRIWLAERCLRSHGSYNWVLACFLISPALVEEGGRSRVHTTWLVHIIWGFVSAPLSGKHLISFRGSQRLQEKIKKEKWLNQLNADLKELSMLGEHVLAQLWPPFRNHWVGRPNQSGPITIITSPLVVIISQWPTSSAVTSPLCYCRVDLCTKQTQYLRINLPLSKGAPGTTSEPRWTKRPKPRQPHLI